MNSVYRTCKLAIALFCCLTAIPKKCSYADNQGEVSTRPQVNPTDDEQSAFYTSNRVHKIHLELTKQEWKAMAPVGGREEITATPAPSVNGEQRVVHRNRFPWSLGTMRIDGESFNSVGIRYKGNASFNLMKGSLKRNLKVKLDWTDEQQRHCGIKTFNFNAGGLDPSKLRDALGYAVFREAGLPAPRTTFAEVTLTVPGIHDQVHLGLFTLVEQVNKSFLKSRFDSSKGLLMKPEGVLAMDFRGEDWPDYESVYRPDDPPTPDQARRVIQFARLVNLATDEEFAASIDSYLDIEGFLRFIAINALIVNLDTLLAMPQNYYLYINPVTDKFVFFPWDLDISFAGWPLGGPPDKQMQLSLRHPHQADGNKLIDRLFSIPSYKARYDKIIDNMVHGLFSETNLLAEIHKLEGAVNDAFKRDTAATHNRNERGYPAPRGYHPPSLSTFVQQRHVSIRRQLSGEATGYIYATPQPRFGRSQLALHILVQGDNNQDRRLSRKETVKLFDQWFDAMQKQGKETLTKKEFIEGLPDALFPADFPHSRPARTPIPEAYVADGLFSALAAPQSDIITKQGMTLFIGEWYDKIDADNRDQLDRGQLTNALRQLIPH